MGAFTYRAKPCVIEAWQNLPQNQDDMPEWLQAAMQEAVVVRHHIVPRAFAVVTTEGTMRADFGDFIVRGLAGEIYPCKEDVFLAKYEPAEDEEAEITVVRPVAEVYDGPPEVSSAAAAEQIAQRKINPPPVSGRPLADQVPAEEPLELDQREDESEPE